jgi:hypothetical protein
MMRFIYCYDECCFAE